MKPNTQNIAVQAWRFLEANGIEPSARKASAMLRAAGVSHDEHLVREWLRPFAEARKTAVSPQNHRTVASSIAAISTAPIEHDSPHSTPHVREGQNRDSTCGYAREKEVSLFPSIPSGEDADASSAIAPEQERRKRSRKQTPEQIEAHRRERAVLDAALEVIEQALGPLETMTPTEWRQRNKTCVRGLLAAKPDRTPEDVAKMLRLCFADEFYPRTPMLDKLQKHWTGVRERATAKRQNRSAQTTSGGAYAQRTLAEFPVDVRVKIAAAKSPEEREQIIREYDASRPALEAADA